MQERTYYDILGISEVNTRSEVKEAYKKLAPASHPDHGGDPAEFKRIQTAYETLYDEKLRGDYDEMLSSDPSTFVTIGLDYDALSGDSKSLICTSEINLTQLIKNGAVDDDTLERCCVANEELALSVLNDPELCSKLLSTFSALKVFLVHKSVMRKLLTTPALYRQLSTYRLFRLAEQDVDACRHILQDEQLFAAANLNGKQLFLLEQRYQYNSLMQPYFEGIQESSSAWKQRVNSYKWLLNYPDEQSEEDSILFTLLIRVIK